MIADHRGHRRPEAGVADADADAEQHHLSEAADDAAAGDHDAEHGQRDGDDLGAVQPLGHPGHGQAEQGIEDGEARALDQAQLPAGQVQLMPERRRRGGDALPVGEVEGVDHQKDEQHPGAIALGEPLAAAGGLRGASSAGCEGRLGRAHGFPPALLKALAHSSQPNRWAVNDRRRRSDHRQAAGLRTEGERGVDAGDLELDDEDLARIDAAFPLGPKPRSLPMI